MEAENPLAFLGLQRVGDENNSPAKATSGENNIELNNRGLPARKRKKNSLIFGGDDVVSMPVRSPRKKTSPIKNAPTFDKISSRQNSPSKITSSPNGKISSRRNSPVKSKSPLKEKVIDNEELNDFSIHINSSDVRRLARQELNSLLNDITTTTLTKSPEEKDNFSDYSVTDPEDNSFNDDEESDHFTRPKSRTKSKSEIPIQTNPVTKSLEEEINKETPDDEKDDDKISMMKRLNAQRLGVALRNLLKLPKAHKWVCFEFFYSNIDNVLFCSGENDFMLCLKESFPSLKTRRLTRVEWCKVRRLMGKPRRCSSAFFTEERQELERKRERIRGMQQRQVVDPNLVKDLPSEDIPMQLTLGAKVTARLRQPQDGLYCGTVDAVDPNTSTYRITFDRPGLGTHSIPDFEVLSIDPPDLLPVQTSFSQQQSHFLNRNRFGTGLHGLTGLHSRLGGGGLGGGGSNLPSPAKYMSVHSPLTNDPLLSGSVARSCALRMDQVLGGYPVRYLFNIVKLNKCLKAKREKMIVLKELNTEAEMRKSYGTHITEDYQKKYASIVMDIYKINEELNSYLRDVTLFTAQLGNEEGPSLSLPDQIQENCQEDAYMMVNRYNGAESPVSNTSTPSQEKSEPGTTSSQQDQPDKQENQSKASKNGTQSVHSAKVLALITQLSALMLQIKRVSDGERNAPEMQALKDSLDKIKNGLSESNTKVFEDTAEVHMHLIQQELSQDGGNLTAFNITEDIKN